MNFRVVLALGAIVAVAAYSYVWKLDSDYYRTLVHNTVADIEARSGGDIDITFKGVSSGGYPFSHTVGFEHVSVMSGKNKKEHVEIHSHLVEFDFISSGGGYAHALSWLEPAKVIYHNPQSSTPKRTYMVSLKNSLDPVLGNFSRKNVSDISQMRTPEEFSVSLPSAVELEAECGDIEKDVAYRFDLGNVPLKVDIPDNVYPHLYSFVKKIDAALNGKGDCSDGTAKHHH